MLHNQSQINLRQTTQTSFPLNSALDGPGPEQLTLATGPNRPPYIGTAHLRDTSQSRTRALPAINPTNVAPRPAATRAATAQNPTSGVESIPSNTAPLETGLQRKSSNNYGHHRQTSVIHGMQHSRNPSFNSPSATSPLSPESLLQASNALKSAAAVRRGQTSATDLQSASGSPNSSFQGHQASQSIDSVVDSDFVPLETNHIQPRRRPAASARPPKGHNQTPSGGRPGPEPRTPAEYALHHLFHAFVLKADQKINQCLSSLDMIATPVEQVCGPGADLSFDQLISSLGHVSRQEPRPLVDSLMLWRQAKGDAAMFMKKQMYTHRNPAGPILLPASLPRRHTEPVQANGETALPQVQSPGMVVPEQDLAAREYTIADRKATISVYILCRVLSEVFEQSSLAAITPDLAGKLEDIVFSQLRDVDPIQIMNSSLRLANWRIYGQVLGHMSRADFLNITKKFILQLEAWQQDVARVSMAATSRDLETRIELLLLGMRHIHISTSREDSYATCEFLRALAKLFVDAHGPRIKQAFCQLFERLLLPIAADPECFQSVPKYREIIDMINIRLGNMLAKVRHWTSGFPLSTLLMCISPIDVFTSQWSATLSNLATKLRDRATKIHALQAICQLTWVYLARVNEPAGTKIKRLEEVLKLTIPPSRKVHGVVEPAVSEALVQMIRAIGFRHRDFCVRQVIYPLLNFETFSHNRELRIDQIDPERTTIGIKAFLSIIADLERDNPVPPPFPVFASPLPAMDGLPTSPVGTTPNLIPEAARRSIVAHETPSTTPVSLGRLDDETRKYYLQFCEILGKITILCDNVFGGQATLNEKFATFSPKTPLVDAFSMARKEDPAMIDTKQPYFELLHTAIQALPRCFTDHVPLATLINLLCTCSAHVQSNIAASATHSLKAIARQGYAQAVAIAFPRFIFNYDSQYSTMSDEGRLGPAHIEATLNLYVELLQIWIDQLRQKTRTHLVDGKERAAAGAARALQMELTNVITYVDEIEAYALFFLCSQSRRVRTFAIKVLQLVTQFDLILAAKEEPSRIIKLLETHSVRILDIPPESLSVAERSRLQKDKQKGGSQNTVIDISSSDVSYDSTLWFKAFPNLIRVVFEYCPHVIALSRVFICDRLLLMREDVEVFCKLPAGLTLASEVRTQGRSAATPPDVLFDQWKLYLIMACVTLSSPGAQSQSQLANAAHVRKTSKPTGSSQDKIGSARALFSLIIPMLAAGQEQIRNAVVVALGSINRKLYRTLLESLQYAVITCNDEAKARINSHQRTPSSPQRTQKTERLRTEVTHVYKLTASFLLHEDIRQDEWVLNNLVTYTKDLRIFLSDTDVQRDWRFQKLRFHYCGLVEDVFEGINQTKAPSRWMPFESRKSAFTLMEDWCGYSVEQDVLGKPEDSFDLSNQSGSREFGERINANAATEKDKNNLKMAALSAMAALCAGPMTIRTESNSVLSFQIPRMLSWIATIFKSVNDKMHAIGRRALKLLLLHNPEHVILLEHATEQCYKSESPKALESYFSVVAEVLIQRPDYPIPFWRLLGTVLYMIGNENRDIRMKAANLLSTLDERQQRKSNNLRDFDISISDKTRAVYRLAQFECSRRLSTAYADLAFMVFSEFSLHFKQARIDHQRNMVAVILPWLQTLELQVDSGTGGPTPMSYMLLANMFEITIRHSSSMHNEIQALWQALATGPHAGNVQLILDFIIFLSLERREQNFVEYAKQIVVYLSTTPAGSKVQEFFLLQLAPKTMVNDKKAAEVVVPDVRHLPYVADLSGVLPTGNRGAGLSMGQVSLIFLVDLMVPPVVLSKTEAIKLIHTILILWDHHTPIVQEQAREMLVHLIHELVTTKVGADVLESKKQHIEQIVDSVRGNDALVSWSYESHTGKGPDDGESRVPNAMALLSKDVVEIFNLSIESFSEDWAKEALHWASICPVRHLACRSFQIFRCISVTLNTRMLADMLARLSNTIADEQADYQTFSMEILTTLKVIIGALESKNIVRYSQLFWTTCACLNTIHEREFYETLGMLEKLLDRVDFSDATVVEAIMKTLPEKWEGEFEGMQPLLYKGLKSVDTLDRTLLILLKCASLPDGPLVGHSSRLMFVVLATLPGVVRVYDQDSAIAEELQSASALARIAGEHQFDLLSTALSNVADGKYTTTKEVIKEVMSALRSTFFAHLDADALIFTMGLLTNKTSWFRVKVMDILCEMIPLVDMKNSAITSHGPDLISPLLRLLQTEFCPQALKVMDHIMEVSGNPMERHHLRMSMATGPAKAIRKEYERTQSLYGIPHLSGWSIPMPAVYSSMTRHNVHAVFYTCGETETLKEQDAKTPEVEFQTDESYSNSYFPNQDLSNPAKALDSVVESNVSDLVHTLDSLDDFFDDPSATTTPTPAMLSAAASYFQSDAPEQSTDLYDAHTAPILHQTLTRTTSLANMSGTMIDTKQPTLPHHRSQASLASSGGFGNRLQSSFSSIDELGGPGPSLPSSTKKPAVMSAAVTNRPGPLSRAITSPAEPFPVSQQYTGLFASDTDGYGFVDEAILSDSESSPFPSFDTPTLHTSKSFSGPGPSVSSDSLISSVSPNPGQESGFAGLFGRKRGIRRLTGGKSESQKEKDKARDQGRLRTFSNGPGPGVVAPESPQVPRVPSEYLSLTAGGAVSPNASPGG